MLDLMAFIQSIAESNVAEARDVIAGYFHARDGPEPVPSTARCPTAPQGGTMLDVRPSDEFALAISPGRSTFR